MEIVMEPIGIVHSACKAPSDLPGGWTGTAAEIEVFSQFAEGLADVKVGDRMQVYFHFHLSREVKLTVPLMGVGPMKGVFSTHSPTRPNFIGMTEVTVDSADGLRLGVSGADMLDGTPVLDLKPAPAGGER